MPSETPSTVSRVRWKLANQLWPERLRPDKLLTRWRLRASEAEAVGRWRVASSDRPRPEARSQNGEDALLWDLVGDRQQGFFIEAGAYDGYEFSVSYLFECAGWSGLLVEPLADRAAQAADRRKASRVVTAALSRPGAPSTATFRRDEIEWYSKLGDEGEQGNVVEVTTLDSLLEGHIGGIDFVVLDLEGHELAALEGFDLERWRPSVLLVENNDASGAVRRYVGERGYDQVLTFANNDLYVQRDEAGLVQRLGQNWEDVGPV
jgi:FkbM family methyltransferase